MKTAGRYFLLLTLLGLTLFSSTAQALTCKALNSVSETVAINSILKASLSDLGSNRKIWVSSPITATFTCTDTNGYPQGESAYLWLDPNNVMRNVHNSLEVGITYKNIDYKLVKGDKVEIGPGTIGRPDGKGGYLTPATPQTFTLTYQVYIKTTGLPAAQDGKVMGNVKLSLFQVDGVGGLRGITDGDDGNFNLYITGLDNITFLSCTPTIKLMPESLDFGSINRRRAYPGRIEKIQPFTVQVDLTQESDAGGKNCTNETLLMTLSSSNVVKDNEIIMPAANSGFGFIISEQNNLQSRIPLNTPQTFGVINSEQLTKNFYAGFIWTATSALVGPYSAAATVTITFK